MRFALVWFIGSLVLAGMLGAGCGTFGSAWVTDPVGPMAGSDSRFLDSSYGVLKVFTDKETHHDGGIVYHPNTPYHVTTVQGKKVKTVQNRVGLTDQRAQSVPLPAGEYLVHARAQGKGWVTVPVAIAGGRMTIVNLEYRGLAEADTLAETERVQLPDGRVIGRRAPPARAKDANLP